MKLKKISWILIAVFAIIIGLHPLAYYFVDMKTNGLLSTKPQAVLDNAVWHGAFYAHITFGGIALLTGWTQFSKKLREKYLSTHRLVGKIYVIAVGLSSISGLFIAFFATGGIGNVLGFGILAMLWFITVFSAYTSILKRDVYQHENWMIRNYALTLAAVTLRIWLPLLSGFVFHDFIPAYRIVSWLCWVPNLIIAEIIISKRTAKPEQVPQTI
ncbi:Predicted membrane protein [Mucilaginibacter sp. OK268]|uniref:DUF2306 domain-containing protein n=1 Tax=Mucilaginibacter sp. OK268 TaxID=1881048 RepID=UPI00088BFBA3|nr:DUF2306 domain-containing protein [Mucilaginibacter sp. OK268]SDP30594.1 Predicted membrane protein [Mucilaginibacter sp. OK268]